jgi:hypothetical protein
MKGGGKGWLQGWPGIPVGLPLIDTVCRTSHDLRLGPNVKASMEFYPA